MRDRGVDITEAGYLYLASPARVGILEANHEIQRAEGADVVLLTPAELAVRRQEFDAAKIPLQNVADRPT